MHTRLPLPKLLRLVVEVGDAHAQPAAFTKVDAGERGGARLQVCQRPLLRPRVCARPRYTFAYACMHMHACMCIYACVCVRPGATVCVTGSSRCVWEAATAGVGGCNRFRSRLQPHAFEAATVQPLQPQAFEAATACAGGCNRMFSSQRALLPSERQVTILQLERLVADVVQRQPREHRVAERVSAEEATFRA